MNVDTFRRASGLPAPAAVLLRVLTGPNAGAELALHDGTWLIGSGDDADLTFAEPALAPEHLRLIVSPGGLELQALADGVSIEGEAIPAGETRALPTLARVAIGATVFTTGPPASAWPNPAMPAAEPLSTELAPLATEPVADNSPAAAIPTKPRRRAWPVIAALAILAAGGIVWRTWPEPPPPIPLAAVVDAPAAARAVIDALGLSDWVTVTETGKRIAVAGQVRSDRQLRQLMAGLRQAEVDAEVAVLTDDAALDLVRTILSAFAIDAKGVVTGPGAIVLNGFAPDSGRLEMAVRRLQADVPGLRTVEDRIATPDRARITLERAVQDAGLGRALRVAAVPPAGVSVTGALGPASTEAWNALAAAFRTEHGDRIPLTAQVAAVASAAPRGVQLGSRPMLIMDDGRRLGVGDMLDTVGRIVAVDERRVRVRTTNGDMDLPYSRPPSWITEDNDAGK